MQKSNEISVDSIVPSEYRGVFKFQYFNDMQSEIVEQALQSDVRLHYYYITNDQEIILIF
jgi:hypothetical protein